MAGTKTIGFVFIPGMADWEHGLLSASAVEWFGAKAAELARMRSMFSREYVAIS